MSDKVKLAITTSFLEKVNQTGYLPWSKPWEMRENKNYSTKHEYTGINRWMTSLSEYGCPYWLTYKKAKELNFQVAAGSKSTRIIFLGSGKDKRNDDKSYKFLRYYSVFNLEQTNATIPEEEENKAALLDITSLLESSRVPTIKHGDSQACYIPSRDNIHIPYKSQFNNEAEFYSTLFHELIHSTGHHTRLDRTGIVNLANMDKTSYSFEELVAEIGAAILCSKSGKYDKANESNSISYVQGWKSKLSNNTDWLISAASQAEKAVRYLTKED